MNASSSLKLYIARVELFHSKNFVANTLQNIGYIKEIQYINKKDFNGNDYYSAVVTFIAWIDTPQTNQLFQELANDNKQTRLYYSDIKGNQRYWIIKEHIPQYTEKQITEITQDVLNTSINLEQHYYKLRNIALEKQLQDNYNTNIIRTLQIDYLNERLDTTIQQINDEQQTITQLNYRIKYLSENNDILNTELNDMKLQILNLEREIKDKDKVLDYYENLTHI